MPSSRSKTSRRPAVRKQTGGKPASARSKAGKPSANTARRKTRTRRLTEGKKTAQRKKQSMDALPGWSDLATSNERTPSRPRTEAFLDKVSTVRFGLIVLAVAAAFTFYVGHVHATQDVLAELQRARRESLQLHLKHNWLKGAYDQATGPAVIYQRARAMGLVEDVRYGPTIEIEDP